MVSAGVNAQAVAEENALLQPVEEDVEELRLPDDDVELAAQQPEQQVDLHPLDHPQQHAGMPSGDGFSAPAHRGRR